MKERARMDNLIDKKGYLHCPQCRQRTEQRIRADTLVCQWPMYCSQCGQESIINVLGGKVELSSSKEEGGVP